MFTDLSEALQYGCFDAVVIMVPHNLHLSFATSCLEAGKHVLLEKPLGHTVEACRELLATAERVDKVFMVGENSPFWPEVQVCFLVFFSDDHNARVCKLAACLLRR